MLSYSKLNGECVLKFLYASIELEVLTKFMSHSCLYYFSIEFRRMGKVYQRQFGCFASLQLWAYKLEAFINKVLFGTNEKFRQSIYFHEKSPFTCEMNLYFLSVEIDGCNGMRESVCVCWLGCAIDFSPVRKTWPNESAFEEINSSHTFDID